MLYITLSGLSNILSNHLKLVFGLTEDIVCLCALGSSNQVNQTNKIHLTLVNIERETAGGIQFNRPLVSKDTFKATAPAWQLNLYVLIAANFSEKQYKEGLQFLSSILLFIQSNNVFTIPETGATLSLEPVNMSFSELSNLWGICGGTYYPSILCKIRVISFDGDEMKHLLKPVTKQAISHG